MDLLSNVLVTGGSGFLGTQLCRVLKTNGTHVTALGTGAKQGPWDRFWDCNVAAAINPSVMVGQNTVFHLAAKVHSISEVKEDEREYFRINTEGTRHVLEAARVAGVRRFVFFSTIKAMSREALPTATDTDGQLRPWTETDIVQPDTPYGRSKLAAEELVLRGGFVPEPVVLRLCMVYGTGGKGNMQAMLRAVAQSRFPPLPDVGNRRSMVHFQDVVQSAILAGQRQAAVGNIFIVSDGRSYSTRQIYELMCTALGRPVPRWNVPIEVLRAIGRAGDVIGRIKRRRFIVDSYAVEKLIESAWFSSNKLETTLGFRPTWDLEAAMPQMAAEVLQHRLQGTN